MGIKTRVLYTQQVNQDTVLNRYQGPHQQLHTIRVWLILAKHRLKLFLVSKTLEKVKRTKVYVYRVILPSVKSFCFSIFKMETFVNCKEFWIKTLRVLIRLALLAVLAHST